MTTLQDTYSTALINKTYSTDDVVCGPNYSKDGFIRGEINVPSLVALILFYMAILAVGVFASWRNKTLKSQKSEDLMLARRNIGPWMGLATLTATWVGGGYINGTAERVFKPHYGLMWTQAPIGYSLSLVIAGFLFGKKMRDAGYVTMLDPIQQKYGRLVTSLCYIPALMGDVFWSAAILSALGSSLSVIVGLNHVYAVLVSTFIALLYTLIGGLYSVMFTDIIQLGCIFVGLWLAIPFALKNNVVGSLVEHAHGHNGWLGEWPKQEAWSYWFDGFMLLTFGGIPWQVITQQTFGRKLTSLRRQFATKRLQGDFIVLLAYFQRVLALRTSERARTMSVLAGVGCFLMAIPAVWIGAIGNSADWSKTDYAESGCVPIPSDDYRLILPLVMQYLTPTPVAIIGLGAVSAAVMSSADSSILSASSMFAHNIYLPIRTQLTSACSMRQISEVEQLWVLRFAMIAVAAMACTLASVVNSIYGLFYLCGDLVYVILFPQLLLVIYMKQTNTYGALMGYIIGMFFRLTAGEHLLKYPALIKYPWYHKDEMKQYFPIKTFCMLMSMLTIICVSLLTNWCFKSGKISTKYDILDCFNKKGRVENGDNCNKCLGSDEQNPKKQTMV